MISTFVGGIAKLSFVWVLADTSMFFMAIINLVAIILLGKWAMGALRDFEANPEGAFGATGNPHRPAPLETEIWVESPPRPRSQVAAPNACEIASRAAGRGAIVAMC